MAYRDYRFINEPDWWAWAFLIDCCLWDAGKGRKVQDADEMNPELAKHIYREALEKGDYTLRFWRGDFYRWERGRYIKVSDSDMRCWVTRFVRANNDADYGLRKIEIQDTHVRITGNLLSNIMVCLAGFEGVHLTETTEPNTWKDSVSRGAVAAFENGLLIMPNNPVAWQYYPQPQLTPHTPEYFTLTKLPYYYNREAECPRWQEFLADVMEGDAERIALLQQWAGYLLTPSNEQQKFLLIAGEGQNGKTVFTTIIEKMVGEENVTHVPLSQFGKDFALAATLGKVLNSTSESSGCVDELAETTLKSYTSGDRMTFQRKYREPVHARPTAKIMISTNQLPQFGDKSMGIWRRMLFVPFDKSYGEQQQNHNLTRELSCELSGIFNWAYEGLKTLVEAGRFILPARCNEQISQYRRDVNPARVFLQDNYVAGLEYEGLPCAEVYQSYVRWCKSYGYRPLNNTNFGKEVPRVLPAAKRHQRQIGGRRSWFYSGIAVSEGSEVATELVEY